MGDKLMTSTEAIGLARMLLDSDHEYYFSMARVIQYINQAQDLMIHALHLGDDERGLRTLYDVSNNRTTLSNGAILPNDCMYPKGLNIYPDRTNANIFYSAEYLDYDKYITSIQRAGAYMNARFPHSINWTYQRQWNNATNSEDTILLHTTDNTLGGNAYRASLSYIRRPALFTNAVPISLPQEYHFSVVALASELINNIDVNEFERGEIAYTQQNPISIQGSGEIG